MERDVGRVGPTEAVAYIGQPGYISIRVGVKNGYGTAVNLTPDEATALRDQIDGLLVVEAEARL